MGLEKNPDDLVSFQNILFKSVVVLLNKISRETMMFIDICNIT